MIVRRLLSRLLHSAEFVAVGAASLVARSAAGGPLDPLGGGFVQGYLPPARDLPATIIGIINFVLILVGVLALAFLVYGGFRYITSRGEEDDVQVAKDTIVYAVIGIVVVGIAAAVVNFVIGGILLGAR